MQSRNKPLADFSNLVANAVGAAKGVGDELKAMSRSQAERFIADMDLVTREELDVLKARLDAALEEIEALKAPKKPAPKPRARKTAEKKPAAKKTTGSKS